MSTKKRLFEVFSKVNRVKLNEADLNDTEAMNNFVDNVDEDVIWYFNRNPKMFQDGIPSELKFNIQGQDVILTLDEEEPIDYEESSDNQIKYKVLYNFTILEIPFEVFVPVIVIVEKTHDGRKIVFHTETWFDKDYIHVQRKQQ